MKKAIVVGASSGIGRSLAKLLAENGYQVGLVARRRSLLVELQAEINRDAIIKEIDVADTETAIPLFGELIQEMGGVDLVVICAAIVLINETLDWNLDRQMIATNVEGFSAIADTAMRHFLEQSQGHLVGISSIAGLRGHEKHPAYNASKAYLSMFLDALRHKVCRARLPITITTITPGFVDTSMAGDNKGFWVAPVDKVARQILRAIEKKKKHAYVSRRARFLAWFFKWAPDAIYDRS